MNEVQIRWKDREVAVPDGIMFADGSVIVMRSETTVKGTEIHSAVEVLETISLEALLSRPGVSWFEVEQQCEASLPESGVRAVAGGGDMGNEGFVALEDLSTGALVWVAFFSHSNPFEELEIDARKITATNNRDEDWLFPISRPSDVLITR